MTDYIIRAATRFDAHRIAPLLRRKDVREIKAASGKKPEVSLLSAFDRPGEIVFAEETNGKPILIGGVCETCPRVATIWMVGTPLLEQHAMASVRVARRWIERWHETYPLLWNMAWEENDLHVRWLKLLGFHFIRRVNVRGNTFIEFAKHCNVRDQVARGSSGGRSTALVHR